MILIDANLLLYSRDSSSSRHQAAREWLTEAINGPARVGFPWPSLIAFLRISTHPRVFERPLAPETASEQLRAWLAAPACWSPLPTERHADLVAGLITSHELRGTLISDVHLVALAIEHGLTVCSTDTDFARFPEVDWDNPIA